MRLVTLVPILTFSPVTRKLHYLRLQFLLKLEKRTLLASGIPDDERYYLTFDLECKHNVTY